MINRSLSPGTFSRQKVLNRIGLLMNCLATVQFFSYLINTIQGLECNQLPKPHYSVSSSRIGSRMATDSGRQATPACRPESLHARKVLRFAIYSGWGRVPDVMSCAARFAPCMTLYAVTASRSWISPSQSPFPFSVLPRNSVFSEFQARGRGGCKRF